MLWRSSRRQLRTESDAVPRTVNQASMPRRVEERAHRDDQQDSEEPVVGAYQAVQMREAEQSGDAEVASNRPVAKDVVDDRTWSKRRLISVRRCLGLCKISAGRTRPMMMPPPRLSGLRPLDNWGVQRDIVDSQIRTTECG